MLDDDFDPTDHDNYEPADNHNDPIDENVKSPAVEGEEDVFSGDATDSVSPDIDKELEKVGLHGDDEESLTPLDLKDELEEEEK